MYRSGIQPMIVISVLGILYEVKIIDDMMTHSSVSDIYLFQKNDTL